MTEMAGRPVLAGREPSPSPARGLPGRLRRHGDREETQSRSRQGVMEASSGLGGGEPQKLTRSQPPASYIHPQSSPCLRKSLAVIPLPQKFTHSHPPVSENHSLSSLCLRKSHTVIPLPQKITYSQPLPHTFTHSHPPASENHSQTSPCLRKSLTDIPLHQ